jgi:hypothetical protein
MKQRVVSIALQLLLVDLLVYFGHGLDGMMVSQLFLLQTTPKSFIQFIVPKLLLQEWLRATLSLPDGIDTETVFRPTESYTSGLAYLLDAVTAFASVPLCRCPLAAHGHFAVIR